MLFTIETIQVLIQHEVLVILECDITLVWFRVMLQGENVFVFLFSVLDFDIASL